MKITESYKFESNKLKYGLRHKKSGNILGFSTRSYGSNRYACTDPIYTLSIDEDNMWLVDDSLHAEYVRRCTTEYYNADYSTPENPFDEEDLEVIVIQIAVTPIVTNNSIVEEYLKEYDKSGRFHKKHYSIYELQSLLEENKK